jgi:membrane-associated phospholipid phosphatase
MVRRRVGLRPAPVLAAGALAPLAACVALPPGRGRQAAVCVLNMWAYLAAYEMPNDDPEALRARVRVAYPIAIDTALGLGATPTIRLQRAFARPGAINRFERVLVWCHWLWFLVPHASVIFVLVRDPDRAVAAAARMYAVFDLGAVFYWTVPTAPPWWAASEGRLEAAEHLHVRRMMIEYGEQFWGSRWTGLYSVLGGNPLAAMPSLHFATSLMAAHLLAEVGPVAGAIGWAYASTLGLALVYLGEHYAADLLVGAGLTEGVRLAASQLERTLPRAGEGRRRPLGAGRRAWTRRSLGIG